MSACVLFCCSPVNFPYFGSHTSVENGFKLRQLINSSEGSTAIYHLYDISLKELFFLLSIRVIDD